MNKIALCIDLSTAQIARLQTSVGQAKLVTNGALHGCDIAFGNPEPEEIVAADSIRWVQLESVGFGEYIDLDWSTLNKRLKLTNLAGFFADPVAESALAGILALGRGVNRLVALQSAAEWAGDPIRADLRLLKGAHVVMLGYGAINRRLAELLQPFGCMITPVGSDAAPDELDTVLPTADVFVSAVPDTPATRNLMNAARLDLLPAKAVFVNLGRGSLVDESALVDALQQGWIAGAVLDVTIDEPLPRNHPFWSCPNIILTQHSGGGTADELDRKIDVFAENFARYRRGEALLGVVDLNRGY